MFERWPFVRDRQFDVVDKSSDMLLASMCHDLDHVLKESFCLRSIL